MSCQIWQYIKIDKNMFNGEWTMKKATYSFFNHVRHGDTVWYISAVKTNGSKGLMGPHKLTVENPIGRLELVDEILDKHA